MAESPFVQSAEYSVDLVYPSPFIFGQTPLQMQWAAVAAGATAGPLTRSFDYCDLGCGDGSALCLLAACYPQASFVGIDINAVHIDLGRERAERAGLGNIRFLRASFADLAALDLPEFDYIAAYGVYSWLSPGLQAAVDAFASRSLRIGGLLALHYSCLPGSAIRDPLSFYLRTLANATAGSSAARFASGLAALQRLAPVAGFFRQSPHALALLENMSKAAPAYVAHDVLNHQLHSFYCGEVHSRFEALGFSYLASAHVLPNYPELLLSPQALAAFRQLTAGADPLFCEAVRDLMLNTELRFDLFCKRGQSTLARGERLRQLGGLYVQRADPRSDIDLRRRWSAGCAVDLTAPLYATVLDLAAAPAITLGEILKSAELEAYATADVEQVIEHLFAIGLINVLLRRPIDAPYRRDLRYRLSSPLNALVLKEKSSSNAAEGLASPVLGSPLLVPPAARRQLLALLGDDPDRSSSGKSQFVSDGLPQLLRAGIVEEDRKSIPEP